MNAAGHEAGARNAERASGVTDATDTSIWPDPTPRAASLTALFPFALEALPADDRFANLVRASKGTGAWSGAFPADRRKHLARWFYREVRTLFLQDASVDGDGAQIPAKLRWFDLQAPLAERGVAIVRRRAETPPASLDDEILEVQSVRLRLEVFALLAEIGVCIVGLRLRPLPQPGCTLSELMDVAHFLSYEASDTSHVVVLLPPGSALADLDEPRSVRRAELGDFDVLSFSTQVPATAVSSARDHIAAAQVGALLEGTGAKAYLACAGKVPVVFHVHLGEEDSLPAALEWQCARFHRHFRKPGFAPLADCGLASVVEPRVRTLRVAGARRFHLSCDGFLAISTSDDAWEIERWPKRVEAEYTMCYALALLQSVVVQDISWRAYSRASIRGVSFEDHYAGLYRRFCEFDTTYNFTRVSQQSNVQSVYELARGALGVPELTTEVREELSMWIEGETQKEQRALNAMAVIALLSTLATALIGLNLNTFSSDAKLEASSRWFWVPIVLTLLVVAITRRGRRSVVLAARYLWGRD
jgi:hypothetical protein